MEGDAVRRRGWGAHVKPSTATTGSRMMSMVKYLHKRQVKRPMKGEQQAATAQQEGAGASLIGHVIGHPVLVKRGCSAASTAACNRARGSVDTGCGRRRRLEDRGGCSCRGAGCSAA